MDMKSEMAATPNAMANLTREGRLVATISRLVSITTG
jgi:hypothetical protein